MLPSLNRLPLRPTPLTLFITGLVLAVLGAVSGCQTTAERTVYEDAKGKTPGPLSAEVLAGGFKMAAPKKAPWHASFGGYTLCTKTGDKATIENVRPIEDPRHKPLDVTVYDVTGQPAPMYAAFGKPPNFPDLPRRPEGSFDKLKTPLTINDQCKKFGKYDHQLMITQRVGREGSRLKRLEIDYKAGGKPYTLRVAWEMTACGTTTGCNTTWR